MMLIISSGVESGKPAGASCQSSFVACCEHAEPSAAVSEATPPNMKADAPS